MTTKKKPTDGSTRLSVAELREQHLGQPITVLGVTATLAGYGPIVPGTNTRTLALRKVWQSRQQMSVQQIQAPANARVVVLPTHDRDE